ncbi:MAG: hypothetical protein KGL53_11235, partial [Elusimicrobia bacterium]|nr:hypothetical protein [Elusimicrobiota bacterium]
MRKTLRLAAAAGLAAAFVGCVQPPAMVIRDRADAVNVKKVAIMPFFDAQSMSAMDPTYDGMGSSFIPALQFDALAHETLSKRFELIDQKDSLKALEDAGVQFKHVTGAWSAIKDPESVRWGYTPDQAVKAAKSLGADAALLCAQGQFMQQNKPMQGVVVRLLDANTGKVLWGVSATAQPGLFSKDKTVRDLLA